MMRKIMLMLSLLIFACSCYGKLQDTPTNLKPILLNLKSTIENHFSGKNIHDLREPFIIEYSGSSKKYNLISNANDMLPLSKSDALNIRINKFLKSQNSIKLTGTIYFDQYSDSALVYIELSKDETVYQFYSMESSPQPPGGLKIFSKRLHDFLKKQIAIKQLIQDSVFAKEKVNFNVDRSGVLSRANKDYLSNSIEAFIKSEKRWNPGLQSGRMMDIQVEFRLLKEYLTYENANWPSLNDFSENVNINLITSNKIGSEITFYSSSFPRKFSNNNRIIVSMVYDSILGKYRTSSVHSGSLFDTDKLIRELYETPQEGNLKAYAYKRIYFYRNK
ncbi:hypothetical protein [Pedobacter frigiditerrae]|uniref:hypothetical protein n=1 Tax=Pedobacter frigiditerrae TaxID=2530452 RepID=UPI00292E2B50|nr:hypothetical protein [Pedobacter frigiditerrae]